MSDDAGAVVWKAAYRPFGAADVKVDKITNNLRFAGQYADAETGLHYNYNRYYDPATGRYLSADPIGLAGGVNLFAYVQNDPVNWVDPQGLFGWDTVFKMTSRFILNQIAKFGLKEALGKLGVTEQSRLNKGAIIEQNYIKMQAARAFDKCMQQCQETSQNECKNKEQDPYPRQDPVCVNKCLENLNIAMDNL